MKRVLVTAPDELHEIFKELALRKKTSMPKLLLAAAEDVYEDDIDVIEGEKGLLDYLANRDESVSIEELVAQLKKGRAR